MANKLERYQKFLSFMLKYWNSDLVQQTAANAMEEEKMNKERDYDQSPEELVEDLKSMGPTYIKLGQLLSTRPDLLPDAYLNALTELQDDVEPIPYDQVREIVEEELGARISKAFDYFEEEPLASASIGQVHKAKLRSGKLVAVKVQRPDIRKKFMEDLDTLQEVATLAINHSKVARKYAIDDVLEDLRRILMHELNYIREGQNLLTIHENLQSYTNIIVPLPILDYTTGKVLTMEYMEGKKITSISPLRKIENDYSDLVDSLIEAYLQQLVSDGFAHADPHPGNVHLTKEDKIILMDLGMVAQFSPQVREFLLQLLIAVSQDNGEGTAKVIINMSRIEDDASIENFKKTISQLIMDSQNATAEDVQIGKLLLHMNRAAAQNGIHIPVEVNILGKILLNLDQIVVFLAPNFDLKASLRKHLQKLMSQKIKSELRPENFFSVLLEAKKLAENLPERMNKISEKLANNELELKIDAIDEERFTDGFQKVANRITLGLIIAATIIGAAMLMSIPTNFTIAGYPGLAIIFFLIAALGGISLSYVIIFKDKGFRDNKKGKNN
ncbi:MAG TPA: AarF/UbiB family protein [Salinimicrobium sp.]|nr:AarF/UbiB family protein [Salinimicrobium sp.]